jgi:hypothetical protein
MKAENNRKRKKEKGRHIQRKTEEWRKNKRFMEELIAYFHLIRKHEEGGHRHTDSKVIS